MPDIQGHIGQHLKAQYDVAAPIPDRLAELLEQLAQLEFLKDLAALMDEPDSKGGVTLKVPERAWLNLVSMLDRMHCFQMALQRAAVAVV